MENMILVPFTPDHPHAQRIVDGWNNAERLKLFEEMLMLRQKLTALEVNINNGVLTGKTENAWNAHAALTTSIVSIEKTLCEPTHGL